MLARARATGTFTATHEAFWAAARKTDGDAAGTRALIDVLLLHRSMAASDVVAGITAALTVGAITAAVVAVEARRHETTAGTTSGDRVRFPSVAEQQATLAGVPRVASLTQRRLADPAAVIAGLPTDHRPAPSMAGYDDLLHLPTHQQHKAPRIKEEAGK